MHAIKIGDQEWPYDTTKILNTEAIALKKFTGFGLTDLGEALGKGDVEAITALVWLARRKNGEPDLRVADVEFVISEVELVTEDEETNDVPPLSPQNDDEAPVI